MTRMSHRGAVRNTEEIDVCSLHRRADIGLGLQFRAEVCGEV